MGVDTHMIAGVRACLTFTPDRSSPTIQTTPHYAEALVPYCMRNVPLADIPDHHHGGCWSALKQMTGQASSTKEQKRSESRS